MAQLKSNNPISTDTGVNDNEGSYNSLTTLSWKGAKCKKRGFIGRVSIGAEFVIEFTLVVHGKTGTSWESILHIGHENGNRSPGIWFHPNSYKLHVRLSDVYDKNKGYDPNVPLQKDGIYKIKFQTINNMVSLYIDGQLKSSAGDVIHITRFEAPVWCGDPWHDAANATIQNLKIYKP